MIKCSAASGVVGWQPCTRTRVSRGSFVASNSFGACFHHALSFLSPRPLASWVFYTDERSLDYPGIILIRPWRRRKVSFEDVLQAKSNNGAKELRFRGVTWVIGETLAFCEREEFLFPGREIMSFYRVRLMDLILDQMIPCSSFCCWAISKNLKVGINSTQNINDESEVKL